VDDLEQRLKVFISTDNYQITGDIAHFVDMRLTDFMIAANQFIAVTKAEVKNLKGDLLFRTSFLNVRRDSIELITPLDAIEKQ
jgi:hypothetical protein